jgi:hypothetical protein
MTRNKEPWYDSDNPSRVVRGASWRGGVWLLAVLAVCVVLSGVGWGISVAVSGPKGAGDVRRQNNSANNRIYAQSHFEDLYGDIKSYAVQIDQAERDKLEHPGDAWFATTFTGLVNTCVSAVNQYNADSGKALFTDWKSADLPERVEVDDCQIPAATPTK